MTEENKDTRSANGFATYIPAPEDGEEPQVRILGHEQHDDACGCGHEHHHAECDHDDHECGCGHDHTGDNHECGCGHDHAGDDHVCECGHDPSDPDHECCGKHHHHHHDHACDCHDDDCCDDPDCSCHDDQAPAWKEPAFTESTFSFDGNDYHVRRWGDPGDIPMVLLHGFMQSGDGWWTVAPSLAQNHCVYALDLLGHGASDAPVSPEAYSLSKAADMVAAFISGPVHEDAVAAGATETTRAHLLGYSMGGRVALEVAFRHPQVLYSLILESAGLGPVDEADRDATAQRNAEWAQRLREEGLDSFLEFWEELPLFASQKRLNPALRAAVRAERAANSAEALACVLEGMGAHTMRLREAALPLLTTTWLPVFYLCGTRDEKYMEQAHDFIHEGFDTRAVMAGHNTHLEGAEYFLEAVDGFLSQNEMKGARR